MNFGLVTSFIIAGILMISILSMNQNISHSSTQLTMRQVTQQRMNTISDILENDIPKIGYNGNETAPDALTDASPQKIEFKSNIDNKHGDLETVKWEFKKTSAPVNSTENPNDYVLTRTVNANTTNFASGVTEFNIAYYDENWNKIDANNLLNTLLGGSQSERNKVRYIRFSLTVESPEPIGGAGNIDTSYVSTTWNKTFSPINLRL